MASWDQRILLDAQASATAGGVTAMEIDPNVVDLNVQFSQSGTATTVTVQASLDNSNWYNMFSTRSATLHGVTVVPRYMRAITQDTADAHVTVVVQYRK